MPIEMLARVSAKSVEKGTGKNWDQWIKILDQAGARIWTHQETVAFLKKKYKLGGWWQQSVTVGYETHIGRRQNGSNLKGEYALTATKSLNVPQKTVWRVLNSPEGMALWLKPMSDFQIKKGAQFEREGGVFGEVRTAKAPERARIAYQDEDWAKPSILQVYVVGRPKQKKSILVFHHEKLLKASHRDALRAQWKQALTELSALLKSGFTGL